MNVKTEKNVMIFVNDKGFYSMSVSRKTESGEYENAYFPVMFKKDVKVENKTLIKINDAWLSFYKTEKDSKKYTNFYVFINDFEIVK